MRTSPAIVFKSHEKHAFRTTDLLSFLTLVAVVFGISGLIVGEALHDDRQTRAVSSAEALAEQIASGGLGSLAKIRSSESFSRAVDSSRGPASVPTHVGSEAGPLAVIEGEMGTDPWGNAFHYNLLRASDGRTVRIFVWSAGPNAQFESKFPGFDAALNGFGKPPHFEGDDVGYVYSQ